VAVTTALVQVATVEAVLWLLLTLTIHLRFPQLTAV
jgi:hypothetical protein